MEKKESRNKQKENKKKQKEKRNKQKEKREKRKEKIIEKLKDKLNYDIIYLFSSDLLNIINSLNNIYANDIPFNGDFDYDPYYYIANLISTFEI